MASSFKLQRMSDYSDAALILEIQRVNQILCMEKFPYTEFIKHSRVSISTIRKRFGSWKGALKSAGLEHKSNERRYSDGIGRRNSTDDDILSEIRLLAQKLGKSILTSDELRDNLRIGTQTLINRFGSTAKAMRSAGLESPMHGRRYTDDECFENLLTVWTHLGRQPKYLEMNALPSQVGPKAYVVRFGSWMKALEKFVERVTDENETVKRSSNDTTQALQNETITPKRRESAEEIHSIRLGQRFRILNRDSFTCALCGDSPALTRGCKLHVDHIVPFSRGGKTIDSNLRCVCDSCNLGRSNNYIV